MAATGGAWHDLKPESIRGSAGYFRVGQGSDRRWWLIDPLDRPFFFRGVNGVAGLDGSPHAPAPRLRHWEFNALGVGASDALRDEGLPFVAEANLATAGALIHTASVRLPDVFDPTWAAAAQARAAETCAPLSARRDIVGWLTDSALAWGAHGAGQPGLLQTCLSLEPAFAAYHAAWEFTLALHRGRLDVLAKAWGQPLANKEVVRELTRSEQGIASRGYLRDEARWTREFARRYFGQAAAAVRTYAPHHLLLGARSLGPAGASVLAECTFPTLDAVWVSFEDAPHLESGPALVGDFSWVGERFLAPQAAPRARELTTIERMLRRGRSALTRVMDSPEAIGYAWSQWRDGEGDQPPFGRGLVHADDSEAREHTELLAQLNHHLHARRQRTPAHVAA